MLRPAFRPLQLVLLAAILALPISARGDESPELVQRSESGQIRRVLDESGQIVGELPSLVADPVATSAVATVADVAPDLVATSAETTEAAPPTIDAIQTGVTYSTTYYPTSGLAVLGSGRTYEVSDGTTFRSGAGTARNVPLFLRSIEVDGDTIRYEMAPPSDGILFSHTSYSGDRCSAGTLGPHGPLVIEATLGETVGRMTGDLEVLSNTPPNCSTPEFVYFSAIVGSIVPFESTITLDDSVWSEGSLDAGFRYQVAGRIDFTVPSYEPPLDALEVTGSAQVPTDSETPYYAVARFESGVLRDVNADAVWSVTPDDVASIESGLLRVGSCDGIDLLIEATYETGGITRSGSKVVSCRLGANEENVDQWETYQGDSRHSGSVPIPVDPEDFRVMWSKEVSADYALNPVAAADGRVFVTSVRYFGPESDQLFALDARDGEILWTKGFGSVFSVNPPAYGYGNVYVQTGNHGSDTWLHAFDAATGDRVYQAAHSAQWERYLAPTVHDGHVFINGGYYGGAYSFNAFSGANDWFAKLPQYDRWTPAVDDERVYAYVEGLHVLDRETGVLDRFIPDPDHDWRGWSVANAPVLAKNGRVIVVQGGRLLSFDVEARSLAWGVDDAFTGQPTLGDGVIYAINDGDVEARSEADGAFLWAWSPPADGAAIDHVIATSTHLFARTADATFAIELLSGEGVLIHEGSGHMAIADEALYIADAAGVLTAISIPERLPSAPVALRIDGASQVTEFTTETYVGWVDYDDGRTRDRTARVEWSVEADTTAAFDQPGELTTGELITPSVPLVVRARYVEEETILEASFPIEAVISVSLNDFVDRNLAAAQALKRGAISQLDEAAAREAAAGQVLAGQRSPGPMRRAWRHIRKSRFVMMMGKYLVMRSVDEIDEAQTELEDRGADEPEAPPKPWWVRWREARGGD